jgi:hypothetical protein
MNFGSDASTQRDAERLILDAVAESVGVELCPKRLTLNGGAIVDVDGVASDGSVLVEVFAHQGQLKGGQRHKIAGDALKLITIAREKTPAPRLLLAFGDPKITTFFAGKSWLAAAINAWQIEVIVVELPSLSTSGETLTIEESMNLEGENGERRNVGDEHEWSQGCG